jgi:hypothetical protein
MKTEVQVKIYNVNPTGFKPTTIQVKEVKPRVFVCRFLDVRPINEFKAMGFTAVIGKIRTAIQNNPTTPLNQLNF